MSFVRLIVGNADVPTLVNADCRTNILLDYCKLSVLGSTIEKLEERESEAVTNIQILESKISLSNAAAMDSLMNEGDSDEQQAEVKAQSENTPEHKELETWKAYLGSIRKALSTFRSKDLEVDFADPEQGGAFSNLKHTLEQSAKDSLKIRGTYNLVCNVKDEEPRSVIDICGTSLAMSPADEKEKAAQQAANSASETGGTNNNEDGSGE